MVLDIGGDIGALLVLLPDSFAGTEIEIGPAGGTPSTHTGVHPRGSGEQRHETAVYPELTTGDYQLWHPTDGRRLGPVVHVDGGVLAELNLLELVDSVGTGAKHLHSHDGGHPHSH